MGNGITYGKWCDNTRMGNRHAVVIRLAPETMLCLYARSGVVRTFAMTSSHLLLLYVICHFGQPF